MRIELMHGACKMQMAYSNSRLPLCGAAAHNIPLAPLKALLFAHRVCARFSRHRRPHRIFVYERTFCHPKEQKPPAAEGGNR
jgi:hypothetical protein